MLVYSHAEVKGQNVSDFYLKWIEVQDNRLRNLILSNLTLV